MKTMILAAVIAVTVATSTQMTITKLGNDYYVNWTVPGEVELIRGDFDENFMLFTKTTVYTGSGNSYLDTVADENTKFFRVNYDGGSKKLDINKSDMFQLISNNLMPIQHNEDSLVHEANIAQFGGVMLLMWQSVYEGYSIRFDYSGSIVNDTNTENSDTDPRYNFYVIDNLNNLTGITVYDIYADGSREAIFSLRFEFADNVDPEQPDVIRVVAGASSVVNINNGSVTNVGGITNCDNRNGMFAGETAGSGGGCLLTR